MSSQSGTNEAPSASHSDDEEGIDGRTGSVTRKPARAKRGRPQSINPTAIVETAVHLLHNQGYAKTSMAEIASACGISRKSLFLYYPAKTDLIWSNMDRYIEGFQQNIAASAESDPLDKVIDAVIIGFQLIPHCPEIMRLQIAMISTIDELSERNESYSLGWRATAADCLVQRTKDRILAEAIAYGVWRAMWKALYEWAGNTTQSSPLPQVRRQLDQFAEAVNKPLGTAEASPARHPATHHSRTRR
ncbi:TetR/AcrR family transcriptional regulator [Nocardia coffeae]|uniref:TetR/AcrR family transcriptional regulator n=1 Tax=Nocardia coffeae TaxID=2873381 RepID=UPI001F44AD16|nr:TetR/AcrR family transcriptional regulator [Nocardia coffeae]